MARQLLFTQERPAEFTFYVHEAALWLPVGDPAVMSDQLHHLLWMSVRSHVTLRVVPVSFGAHSATAGAFRLMEFAEFRPIVYLEGATSSLFHWPRPGCPPSTWRTFLTNVTYGSSSR